jgi:hypothetical protein
MNTIEAACMEIGLAFSLTYAQSIRATPNTTYGDMRLSSNTLAERIRDELSARVFLAIDPRHRDMYDCPTKGWEVIAERFRCGFDVEEASKCLSLGRYTAAVFHLMRVVEAGVLALQTFFGDTTDARAHFGSVLRKLERLTQMERHDEWPDAMRPYAQFLKEVLAQLHAVKDSWRDKVVHVSDQLVPEDTFTEEMATGVRDATFLLMKKLAAGLPPKATT